MPHPLREKADPELAERLRQFEVVCNFALQMCSNTYRSRGGKKHALGFGFTFYDSFESDEVAKTGVVGNFLDDFHFGWTFQFFSGFFIFAKNESNCPLKFCAVALTASIVGECPEDIKVHCEFR